ncbi:endonuclease [Vagococcus penaei]|uniref:Endonuclease n=1 Tax=Vagococcus penaei TaxID=633807 RepID=A0A1Q2D8T7_9ENTE|nr:endonuclease [Vagococcus penaei]RSU05875.1 endonuclease [Vagococcus penaei]
MRIATYNVRVDTEEDGRWSWNYRQPYVSDVLNYYQWDILGLQELLPNQYQDSQLANYHAIYAERDGDGLGEGLAIYYQQAIFEQIETGHFWLSDTPDRPSIHPEAGCRRLAVWGLLYHRESQKTFLVINTHLDHVSSTARKAGVSVLLTQLAKKIDKYPTILLGDFNGELDEALHDELKKRFTYPPEVGDQRRYGPKGTFQGFNYEIAWQELEQIDFILLKNIDCLTYATLTDSCDRRFPSDHFPVVAKIKL